MRQTLCARHHRRLPLTEGTVNVVLPRGKTVRVHAFKGCNAIATVVIPDTYTCVQSGAFSDCVHLASVVLSCNLVTIEGFAFYECRALPAIVLPDTVRHLHHSVFYGCTSLREIRLPRCLESIGVAALSMTALTRIDIPHSVTRIEMFAFASSLNLTTIVIPPNVSSIDIGAFEGCRHLYSIVFTGHVTDYVECILCDTPMLSVVVAPPTMIEQMKRNESIPPECYLPLTTKNRMIALRATYWSRGVHAQCPAPLRAAVAAALMSNRRYSLIIPGLPFEVWETIFEFLPRHIARF